MTGIAIVLGLSIVGPQIRNVLAGLTSRGVPNLRLTGSAQEKKTMTATGGTLTPTR
jgi:hypothetical protein